MQLSETQKALRNFPFTTSRVPMSLIYALVKIKKAAAIANGKTGNIPPQVMHAIIEASNEVLTKKFDYEFMLPWLEGGAGTSINMNVNEVLAIRATEILGKFQKGTEVLPIDHVNHSQSTNDVLPSALRIAILIDMPALLHSIDACIQSFYEKSILWRNVDKVGRTHLMDAVPTTMGAVFGSYGSILKRNKRNIKDSLRHLIELNLGGTAIGNKINASEEYKYHIYQELQKIIRLPLKPAENLMATTSSQMDFLNVSYALLGFMLDLSKIASDIRFLSSGPRSGIGELTISELQIGSTIMPGKVNPILPETVNQLYFHVSGNTHTIECACHAGELELNAMFPTIAWHILETMMLMEEVIQKFTDSCLFPLTVNRVRCRELLEQSTAYATLFCPKIGYETVSELVNESIRAGKTVIELIVNHGYLTKKEVDTILYPCRG